MTGQMPNCDRYLKSLERTGQPIMADELPKVKMDLAGLSRYAKKMGKSVFDLTVDEKAVFVPMLKLK